jgi:hypothetical protein
MHSPTNLKVRSLIVALFIELIYSFQQQFLPANDSACKKNRCQEHLVAREGNRCVWLTILLPSFADYLEILGGPQISTPRGSSRSAQGLLDLFFRIEDVIDLIYVGKKIGHMKFIEGVYFYNRATNNNQLCKKLK